MTEQDRQAIIEVSRTTLDRGKNQKQDSKTDRITIRPFVTATANVSIKRGVTIPIPDGYASERLDVMLSVPCYVEEMPGITAQTLAIVEKILRREQERIEREIK